MIGYELHLFCPECKGFHDTEIRIPLDDSFDIRTVASVYENKMLPSVAEVVMNDQHFCSKTGNSFKQENADHIVLVRPGLAETVIKLKRIALLSSSRFLRCFSSLRYHFQLPPQTINSPASHAKRGEGFCWSEAGCMAAPGQEIIQGLLECSIRQVSEAL